MVSMNRLHKIALILITILSTIFAIKYFERIRPINMTTKTCLITGVSSGIGKYLAIEMVNRGWKVIGVARRAQLLDQLSETLGTQNFIPFVCDVSDRKQVSI